MKFGLNFKKFFNLRKTRDEPLYGSINYYADTSPTFHPHQAAGIAEWYRGISYLSGQIAKLKFCVKDSENREVKESKVSALFNKRINRDSTAFSVKKWMVKQAIEYGNAYLEIERDMVGRPIALWPLQEGYVTPWRDMNGNLYYRAARPVGDYVPISPDRIFHLRNMYTRDSVVGISTITFAARSLGISKSAAEFALQIFTTGGVASGYLKHPRALSDKARKELQQAWHNKDSLLGKIKILQEGMEFVPNQVTDGLQFLETRRFSVLEVSRFLGISPSKLFHSEKYVAASVEEANIESAIDTIDTWCKNFQDEIDKKLLSNQVGYKSEFDLYDLFRGNMQSRAEYFKKMFEIGAISSNEIREKEGLAPYDKGEKYYLPINNLTPVDRIDEQIDASIESKKGLGLPPAGGAVDERNGKLNGSGNGRETAMEASGQLLNGYSQEDLGDSFEEFDKKVSRGH